jgi:hypothetical protein
MLQRLVRTLRIWLGYFISFAEDPEVRLQESIEEMRNILPKLNYVLVTSRSAVLRLELDQEELKRRESQLLASIQDNVSRGGLDQRQAALLGQIRNDLLENEEEIRVARNAFEEGNIKIEEMKANLAAKIEQRRKAIQDLKGAQALLSAASALESINSYDRHADRSFKETTRRGSAAQSTGSIPMDGRELEEARVSRQIRARGALLEFEDEMKRPPSPIQGVGEAEATEQKKEINESVSGNAPNHARTLSDTPQLEAERNLSEFESEMRRSPAKSPVE